MTPKVAVFLLAVASVPGAAKSEAVYVITEADCRLLTRHKAAPDVEYRPGVDVHGRPVAPADLASRTPIRIPETFTIDIDVFLAERLGIPPDKSLFAPEANVAQVTVDGDQVRFNGQSLGDLQQEALAEACREKLGEEAKALP